MDKGVGGEEEDDLMAMLEESQNDFEKNSPNTQKEETKEEEGDLMTELQKAEKLDKEQTSASASAEPNPEALQNDFMKGFEDLAKNLPNMGDGQANLGEKEMKEAMDMFQNMFKFPTEGESKKEEKKEEAGEKAKEGEQANPFLAGYNNMAKDAKSAGEGGLPGLPGMENMGEMFKDEEFQSFFNNFTQGIFKGGEGEGGEGGNEEGFDPTKMFKGMGTGNPEEMMENMMKEMGGYLEENKDDPQIKNTIDEMMSSLVEKDSIYPSLKLMRDEFPDYLEKNEDKVSVKDLERYNEQLDWIEELWEMYEANDKPDKDDVANLLFKLQTYGSPPDELVKKMRESWDTNFTGLGGMGNLPGLGGMGGMGFPGMPKK